MADAVAILTPPTLPGIYDHRPGTVIVDEYGDLWRLYPPRTVREPFANPRSAGREWIRLNDHDSVAAIRLASGRRADVGALIRARMAIADRRQNAPKVTKAPRPRPAWSRFLFG